MGLKVKTAKPPFDPSKPAAREAKRVGGKLKWVREGALLFQKKADPASVKVTPWDLWKDGIRASFVSKFLLCREQCRLHYKEGWDSARPSEYLEFGSAFHYCMERGYKLGKVPSLKVVQGFVAEYEKANKARIAGWNFDAIFERTLGMVETVAYNYFKQWRGDFAFKVLATERDFEVPWKYPHDGKTTKLCGTIDLEFEKPNPRSVWEDWLLDTKTMGEVSGDLIDMMGLNFQFNLYLYAVWKRDGKVPTGVIQNIVRRPALYHRKSEPLKAFLERIAEDIEKRPNFYFLRLENTVTEGELREWEAKTLVPIMQEIRMWEEGTLPTYINPFSLKVQKAKVPLFQALTRGDFSGLVRRPWHGSSQENE